MLSSAKNYSYIYYYGQLRRFTSFELEIALIGLWPLIFAINVK